MRLQLDPERERFFQEVKRLLIETENVGIVAQMMGVAETYLSHYLNTSVRKKWWQATKKEWKRRRYAERMRRHRRRKAARLLLLALEADPWVWLNLTSREKLLLTEMHPEYRPPSQAELDAYVDW